MPPWGAVKGFGEFKEDQGLTQEQIELLADWVEGGAPEGDPKLLPKLPEFSKVHPARLQPGIPVTDVLTLKTAMTLTAIQPHKVPEEARLVVTATRPDGSVEPLLWLYNYNQKFPHTYFYRAEVRLPAGSRIEVTPPGVGTVALVTKARRTP